MSVKEIQENLKEESNILIDEETQNKFLMTEDGYGESKASGIDEDGYEKTISTKDSHKILTAIIPSGICLASDILKTVWVTLLEILNRTKQ